METEYLQTKHKCSQLVSQKLALLLTAESTAPPTGHSCNHFPSARFSLHSVIIGIFSILVGNLPNFTFLLKCGIYHMFKYRMGKSNLF
jgi:hypothetical protein